LNEFSYRFSNRDQANLFGMVVLRLLIGASLPYAKLTSAGESASGS
jgi:hypothetical protein